MKLASTLLFIVACCGMLCRAGEIESIERMGQLVRECSLPGETRKDDIVPRHANAIQLSKNRWLLMYSTHGYRGVDDEHSIIYQIRKDAPDGPMLKEGFVARGQTDWKPAGVSPAKEGTVYYKQHGHMVAFGVPRGAVIDGKQAPNANIFAMCWRVTGRVLELKTGFMPFEKSPRVGQGVEWMQFRLNQAEDDIEIAQPVGALRQVGYETGSAVCSQPIKDLNESFCQPVPANDRFSEWAICDHTSGNAAIVVKFKFNEKRGVYEWTETGPIIAGDKKHSISEPSLVRRRPEDWVICLRGRGEIGWSRSKNPISGWSPVQYTKEPPGFSPMTFYLCPDGVTRLFTNDSRVSKVRHIRDPLFVWDIDVDHDFASSNRQEIFSVAATGVPIRPESHAKIDFPELFPPAGRVQIIAHGVNMRAMNHPTEGWPDIPIQNAAEKDAAGLYYSRITYKSVNTTWTFSD